MIFRLSWHYVVLFVLTVGLLIGTALLWNLKFPYWGQAHPYHTDKPQLPLSPKIGYRQHVIFEREELTGIMLSFDSLLPLEGGISIDIQTQDGRSSSGNAHFSSATTLGDLYVPISRIRTKRFAEGDITITLVGSTKQVQLRYEIDSAKYPEGALTRLYIQRQEEKAIQGTIAFTMEYRQRAFYATPISLLPWICFALVAIGLQTWFWRSPILPRAKPQMIWSRSDFLAIGGTCIVIGVFYGIFWLQTSGDVLMAGDMPKDILYLESARQAFLQGKIPAWHHFTCGGQPLLGNIEANTVSSMLPLALIMGSFAAFKFTLWLEVVFAGVGFYIVARLLGQRQVGAMVPAILIPLGSFISNRIVLGHTMFIGGVAFAPWAIIGFLLGRKDPRWGVVTSITFAAMLGRGDTHVLLYVMILLSVWGCIWAYTHRTIKPILWGGAILTLFLILSIGKLVPTLEAPQHFHTNLPKLVVPLIPEGLFDDVFLRHDNGIAGVKTVHGKLEGWENIGLYTGLGAILVGVLGWWQAPRSVKWFFLIPFIIFVVVGEGTVYELWLRKVPLLGSLLRLPSRVFVVPIWLLALSAGFFIERLYTSRNIVLRIGSIILFLYLIVDIGQYTWHKLHEVTTISYATAQAEDHAQMVPLRNFVAPGACQDFNAPPSFAPKYRSSVSIEVKNEAGEIMQAQMSSNEIRIVTPPAGVLTIYSAPSPLLVIENGVIMSQANAAKMGALAVSVIEPHKDVVIRYVSRTAYGAIVVSVSGFIAAIVILYALRHRFP